jgi:hypothetical protein
MNILDLGIDVIKAIIFKVDNRRTLCNLLFSYKAIHDITNEVIKERDLDSSLILNENTIFLSKFKVSPKLTITNDRSSILQETITSFKDLHITHLALINVTKNIWWSRVALPSVKNVTTMILTEPTPYYFKMDINSMHQSYEFQSLTNLTIHIASPSNEEELYLCGLTKLTKLMIVSKSSISVSFPCNVKDITIKPTSMYMASLNELNLDRLELHLKHVNKSYIPTFFYVKECIVNHRIVSNDEALQLEHIPHLFQQ